MGFDDLESGAQWILILHGIAIMLRDSDERLLPQVSARPWVMPGTHSKNASASNNNSSYSSCANWAGSWIERSWLSKVNIKVSVQQSGETHSLSLRYLSTIHTAKRHPCAYHTTNRYACQCPLWCIMHQDIQWDHSCRYMILHGITTIYDFIACLFKLQIEQLH